MAATTIADLDAIMKIIWTPKRIAELVYSDAPLLSLINKDKNFRGKYLQVPIKYGNSQGTSRTFATAQANAGASKYQDFNITTVDDFGVVSFSNKDLELAKGGDSSFVDLKTSEMESILAQVKRRLCLSLYGDSTNAIGVVATSGVSSLVVTLADPETIVNFEVGQKIDFRTSGGGSSAITTVSKVDRDNGKISVASATGIADADVIYIEGDYGVTGLSGLSSWFPTTAPTTGDNFFGVDRSIDPQRLAGRIIDGSTLPIYEALLEGVRKANRDFSKIDHIILPYTKWMDLEKSLQSSGGVIYDQTKDNDARVGFKSIVIPNPKGGMIKIIADTDCPASKAFLLNMPSLTLHSVGEPIHIDETDGLMFMRAAAANSVEARLVSYCQLSCNAPGFNAVLKLN